MRKAHFKAKTFPKVLKLFKPKIEQAIANLDMSNSADKDGVAAASGAPRMTLATLMEFLRYKIEVKISKGLTQVFDQVTALLWKVIDPIVSALKSSMIAAVGSIPFVGGMLSAVISQVFDLIYADVKTGVGDAITKLQELITTKVVKTILDAVFAAFPRKSDPELIEECASCCSSSDTLDAGSGSGSGYKQNSDWFMKSLGDGGALEAKAAAASKSAVGPMQDTIARQAAESEKAAANTEGELLKDAEGQGAEEQAEQQSEDDEEANLDDEDDADDDEDSEDEE